MATDQPSPFLITWLMSLLERTTPGETHSCTGSFRISKDWAWLVPLIATVPVDLFQNQLAKSDLKVRTWQPLCASEQGDGSTAECVSVLHMTDTFLSLTLTLKEHL